jgi:hypothetical protein
MIRPQAGGPGFAFGPSLGFPESVPPQVFPGEMATDWLVVTQAGGVNDYGTCSSLDGLLIASGRPWFRLVNAVTG